MTENLKAVEIENGKRKKMVMDEIVMKKKTEK